MFSTEQDDSILYNLYIDGNDILLYTFFNELILVRTHPSFLASFGNDIVQCILQ